MKIIYGPKGSGKTKAIIASANETLKTVKGEIVYITDCNKNSIEIDREIRFLDVSKFSISSKEGLMGFLKGVVAANGDIEYVYLDGIARIAGEELKKLNDVFSSIETLEKDFGVKFVLTVSSKKEDLPDFVVKYL